MSIADKILYLNDTKQAIKEAIETKSGITIADEDTFRSYVDRIDEMVLEDPVNLEQLRFYQSIVDGTISGDIIVPDSVTCFGDSTFARNTGITSVIFHDSVISFGSYLFEQSNVKYVQFPSWLTEIPPYCFYFARRIYNNSQSEWNRFKRVGKNAFSYSELKDMSGFTSLIYIEDCGFQSCKFTVANLPNIKTIEKQAFASNYNLTTVNIGNKIESIATPSSSYDRVFYSCSKLTTINIDKPFGSLEVPADHWGATNSTIYWNDGVQTPPNESVNKVI